ncbi:MULTISPECIES: hypothetical protein [unclassified Rathayibacter]|uniref:MmyB family transcriptional regulator n=1 Tax=unclassified Rathayibacter TaxID=2609250 RepID=UPI0010430128|nr:MULTISPECIES: hypothetical protein [unclassified Rathayibacter]MCJ1705507.1 hypothetical protein [Rathayibacter sp. VKM Ac-2926]
MRSTRSDEFRTWWGGHTVRTHTSGTKRLHHPDVGEMTVAYESLPVPSAAGLHLAVYLTDPGSASADALDILRSVAATPLPREAVPHAS